nr:hypothetical protein [Tanacetum cinerariifolium]
HRRDNRETPIPVPKKKHVTFREPQSTTRITSKPDTAIKQPNVSVPLSTRVKPASGASKPEAKSNAWIYRRLSARSGRGEKVATHLRTLNKQNHVDSSFKHSVFMKNTGCDVCHRCLNFDSYDNHVFNSMNSGTRNHSKAKSSVSTTKTVRKPNVVTPKKPMRKPTGRHFTYSSAAGIDNRPPMLEEDDFESWKIRMERYIRGSKPITPFIRTRPAESKIQATLLGLNNTFPFVEKIIKEYTGQRPIHIQEACFEHTKKCFEDHVIPFLDIFKIHVMHCESLYAMNKRNIAKNKSLQIQKKNLLIHDESLIADCIAKD